ncbi:ribosome-associated heat shock protein Hsp15 [Alteromonadaceae bacterium BrNp21-10]|nr:ribosome-associated heat shock protein Hsp15 [Alteromonadaceae bacterium BrNp21-10]
MDNSPAPEFNVRLDKWLWAARFFKTRGLARDTIQGGKVQYNQQRSKPGKVVELGAIVSIPQGTDHKVVIIEKIADQRRSAAEAQLMYRETAESVTQREKNAQARKLNALYSPHPEGKPDKKQRRQLIKAKHL